MGLFNTWKVSGITDKASKQRGTLEFYLLGNCIFEGEITKEFKDNNFDFDDSKEFAFQSFELIKNYISGNKSLHDDAVMALVGLTALLYGAENKSFDRIEIRNFSQGLYGSMSETPEIFESQNIPIFEGVLNRL